MTEPNYCSDSVEIESTSTAMSWSSFQNVSDMYKKRIDALKQKLKLEKQNFYLKRGHKGGPIRFAINFDVDQLMTIIQARWSSVPVIRTREKFSFAIGVSSLSIIMFALGHSPQLLPLIYSCGIVFLLTIRYVGYKRIGYHYFFADICYYVNILLLVWLWILPSNALLFLAVFYLSFGPLAWAIVAWRNSLVFHSLDKVTSVLIHIGPCLVCHCVVHLTDLTDQKKWYPALDKIQEYGRWRCYMNSSFFYIVWQTLYYIFINVRRREKIAAGRPTSFTWLRRSYSNTVIGKAIAKLPTNIQPFVFMMLQFLYTMLTIVPSPIMLMNSDISFGFIIFLFCWSIWNGASYYIDVFAGRFEKELTKLKKEIAEWQKLEGERS